MNPATQSKKATHIESALLNKLALMGQKAFAAAMDVPEYQVSRWKNGLFRQVSMMLAVLLNQRNTTTAHLLTSVNLLVKVTANFQVIPLAFL